MIDNKLHSEYYYQLSVHTGWHRDAKSASRIYFVLSGDNAHTRIRRLADDENTVRKPNYRRTADIVQHLLIQDT